jgi:hypothetical protein
MMLPLTLTSLEHAPGWATYLQEPGTNYVDLPTNPAPDGFGATWLNRASPLLDGPCLESSITGPTGVIGDALNTLQVIGQQNNLGIPDQDHSLLPQIHQIDYSGRFLIPQTCYQAVGAVELDVKLSMGSTSLTFGTQVRIKNVTGTSGPCGFDIWDNVNCKWIWTGENVYLLPDRWIDFHLSFRRNDANVLLYGLCKVGGYRLYPAPCVYPAATIASESTWWGLNINCQLDSTGVPAQVYFRDLSLKLS